MDLSTSMNSAVLFSSRSILDLRYLVWIKLIYLNWNIINNYPFISTFD